jgi:DNA methylase
VVNRARVQWSREMQQRLVKGARDDAPVSGLTHSFYRYPARFSPEFARTAIEVLTKPGELILDPHVGGGTTLVEALVLRRPAVGVDISELAEFVSAVKTTVLSKQELEHLSLWAGRLRNAIDVRGYSFPNTFYLQEGYYKHLDHPSRWRLRKGIEQAIGTAVCMPSTRLEAFVRCVILRTAQWALDGRKNLPSLSEFRERLIMNAQEMIAGARDLSQTVRKGGAHSSIKILNRSAAGLEEEVMWRQVGAPRLVLTSPPYPGVHMLYHRWQVDGRKEAPAPFWIANKLDGAGSSFYTMGDRQFPELRTYFDSVRAAMSSVMAVCDFQTVVVQMVAFSDPSWQLPRYLATMEDAGLKEIRLPILRGEGDGRLWRSVPGRRWYNDLPARTPGAKEVVLFHQRSSSARLPFRRDRSSQALPRPGRQGLGS